MWREDPAQSETFEAFRLLGAQGKHVAGAEAGRGAPPVQRTPYAPKTLGLPLRGTGECGEPAKVHQETHAPSPSVLR